MPPPYSEPPDAMLLGITSGGSVRWRFGEGLDTYVAAAITWCRRRAATFGLVLFLLSLGLSLHTFVADFLGAKAEVHGIRTKVHARLGNVHVRIELAPDGYDLTFERRRKRPETSEVHDVAVGYDFASHISCEVQHALHFHVIEGCVLGHQLAEALEAHAMTTRRGGLDDYLAFVWANAYLALAEGVTNGFVFLTHNYLRCLQIVCPAPVGDVIQGQENVFFIRQKAVRSLPSKPMVRRRIHLASKTYTFHGPNVYVSRSKRIRFHRKTYTFCLG